MSMLKAFFEVGTDPALFERLKISKNRELYGRLLDPDMDRREIVNGLQELTYNELDSSIDHLWSVLFTTGYLTRKRQIEKNKYELCIPNKEIQELFIRQIQEWFQISSRADQGKAI